MRAGTASGVFSASRKRASSFGRRFGLRGRACHTVISGSLRILAHHGIAAKYLRPGFSDCSRELILYYYCFFCWLLITIFEYLF